MRGGGPGLRAPVVVMSVMLVSAMGALALSAHFGREPGAEVLRHFGRQLASVSGIIPAGADRARLLQVRDEINARNQRIYDHAQRFVDDGWKFAGAPEPDAQVLSLDPGALGAKEAEIQRQLQSNSFGGAALDRVRDIAERTRDAKTRALAIEALGRSEEDRASAHLMALYEDSPSTEERGRILTYLRPKREDGPVTEFLARQAESPGAPTQLREQALSHLALMGFTARLSPDLRVRALQLQRAFPKRAGQ